MRGILWIAAHPEMSLLVMVMGATLILPINSGKFYFKKPRTLKFGLRAICVT
jgi:hypothetical protein